MLLQLSGLATMAKGVRVAVIDSGVHAAHPHVQGVAGGIGIDRFGREQADFVDRLGHGTAVVAVIREKAPDAGIVAIKVFDRELATTATALVAAIGYGVRAGAHVINLSLGTANAEHEAMLAEVVADAVARGVVIVAAAPDEQARWLPGALPGVVTVALDWTLPRDACAVESAAAHDIRLRASGFPRPVPGVPPERNLKGVSFAVANATGLLARLVAPQTAGLDYLAARLAAAVAGDSGTTPSS